MNLSAAFGKVVGVVPSLRVAGVAGRGATVDTALIPLKTAGFGGLPTLIYAAKTGFLLFGGLCSKM